MAKSPETPKDKTQEHEDEILRRMLNTPPPHKPKLSKKGGATKKPGK